MTKKTTKRADQRARMKRDERRQRRRQRRRRAAARAATSRGGSDDLRAFDRAMRCHHEADVPPARFLVRALMMLERFLGIADARAGASLDRFGRWLPHWDLRAFICNTVEGTLSVLNDRPDLAPRLVTACEAILRRFPDAGADTTGHVRRGRLRAMAWAGRRDDAEREIAAWVAEEPGDARLRETWSQVQLEPLCVRPGDDDERGERALAILDEGLRDVTGGEGRATLLRAKLNVLGALGRREDQAQVVEELMRAWGAAQGAGEATVFGPPSARVGARTLPAGSRGGGGLRVLSIPLS